MRVNIDKISIIMCGSQNVLWISYISRKRCALVKYIHCVIKLTQSVAS